MENQQKVSRFFVERIKVRGINKGITLLEVLVVMAIVSLLASIAVPVYGKVRVRALTVKTEAVISSLEAALSMYGTDFGDYPASGGEGSSILVKLLQGPVDGNNWKGPYMRFRLEDLDENSNVLDAWKTPLYYRYPQDLYSNIPYVIISAGSDRQLGTDDDIGNW